MDRLMLPMRDSAEIVGIGLTKWYELVMKGDVVSVKVGRRRLIPRAELERFIDRLIEEQGQGAA